MASLDQDRILRSYLTLIQATLRTSFFQRGADGRPKSYVAFKLDPKAIPDLPAPRPQFEIFVYSPRFEGVHLRFGPVARGGLRWSDRRDDFRTEVLGLVKAQMVKNAVIVPVGAKGGFVLKAAPPADRSRRVPGRGRGLLQAVHLGAAGHHRQPGRPARSCRRADVVRHDGDDPYLVVAADKGTATFSDIANAISIAYGFWLGDAFASGGSAGYDHKKHGHHRPGRLGVGQAALPRHGPSTPRPRTSPWSASATCPATCSATACCCREHIRLVAAFDHRHIFIDPTPDAATSFAERRRLFDLPRSSWADYDTSLISAGGGVFPRTAKSIPISDRGARRARHRRRRHLAARPPS